MGRRWLWIALFVSLALNVFIVGGLVGASLTGMRLRPPPPGPAPRGPMAQAVRVLAPEHQAAWRAANPDYVRNFGPKMREGRRLTQDAWMRMGQEPFPRDAILGELNRARALETEGRSAMDQRLVDFAATLPADERARFGEALARPPLGRRGPGGPRGGPPGGRRHDGRLPDGE